MVAAKALGTGDTVLVFASEGGGPTTGKDLVAYGVVHYGAGSEAGAGAALVKVACARDAESFQRLLVACENLAGAVPGVKVLVAGVNTGRVGAFEALRGIALLNRAWPWRRCRGRMQASRCTNRMALTGRASFCAMTGDNWR